MARHPEVSEKSIIQAGLEIENTGKKANPGSIRAHLGYRGGLLRIKSIWETFVQKRESKFLQEQPSAITLDALPESYSSNAVSLMKKVTDALEQLTIEAYVHSQQLFEKRLKTLEKTHAQKLEQYVESEKSADKSVTKLENELDDLQQENQQLAEQNAKLLIENAEYRGRLAVFDSSFEITANKQG
ncbi:hypothetical protein [Aliiglaciecola sp. NS0011-25]|uniref:hypothetical protein n=1 Tax=Aliiglaciecola sp. NS0011-25 TaxID=3127654 RepID=UPI0031065125